jgi:hypothetical protein
MVEGSRIDALSRRVFATDIGALAGFTRVSARVKQSRTAASVFVRHIRFVA